MTPYEILTLGGLIVGPVAAVGITLWYQKRSSTRDRQLQTLRMLVGTRHLAADPAYTVAINMIPIEFNKQKRVIAAWASYIATVRYKPTEENKASHNQEIINKQTKLIFEILQFLKYNLSETDLQSTSYAAQGWTDREDLNIQAQVAWIRIANALEGQNQAAGLPPPAPTDQLIPDQTVGPVE